MSKFRRRLAVARAPTSQLETANLVSTNSKRVHFLVIIRDDYKT